MTKHAPLHVTNSKSVTDFKNSQRLYAISQDETVLELSANIPTPRGENVILAEISRVQIVLAKKEAKILELQSELASRDTCEGMQELNEYITEEYGSPELYSENVLAFYNPDGSRIKA